MHDAVLKENWSLGSATHVLRANGGSEKWLSSGSTSRIARTVQLNAVRIIKRNVF
jgi:hypothetical protein